MKSVNRFLGFTGLSLSLLSTVVLTGCDYNRPRPVSQFPVSQNFYTENNQLMSAGEYPLGDFNTVVVSGAVNLSVKDNAPENKVVATGDPDLISKLRVNPKGCVVYITAKSWRNVNVELDTKSSQAPMHMVVGGKSRVDMKGNYVIQQIDAVGNSNLKLYWLNTSHLKINARDNAKLFLAGVVTHLDITATDRAEINGKYLRAEDSYVYAAGNSNVGVNVRSALGTQSVDTATVYYYKDPEATGIYLKEAGSALRMKGLFGPSNDSLY